MEPKKFLFSFFVFQILFPLNSTLEDFSGKLNGEKLFLANCAVCHPSGKNLVLPEKNLTKESLAANGMNSIDSITYQVRNGKNGMPAFGDRLLEKDIKKIAEYILFQSEKNFEN
jgi:cytochrome c6